MILTFADFIFENDGLPRIRSSNSFWVEKIDRERANVWTSDGHSYFLMMTLTDDNLVQAENEKGLEERSSEEMEGHDLKPITKQEFALAFMMDHPFAIKKVLGIKYEPTVKST